MSTPIDATCAYCVCDQPNASFMACWTAGRL